MAEEGLAKAARALLPGLDADGLRSWMMSFWFGDRMRGPGHAASEDRTHDLRIMRPTRYQLRYRRRSCLTKERPPDAQEHSVGDIPSCRKCTAPSRRG